jgi:hypothetical protein
VKVFAVGMALLFLFGLGRGAYDLIYDILSFMNCG